MKKGAYDYILKPFKVEEVIHVVERALYRQRLQAENIRLREALTIYKVSEAIALSHDIEHILDVVLRAALDEVKADVATLHLRDPRTGALRGARQGRRRATRAARRAACRRRRSRVLLEQFAQGVPILAHGGKASRFFTEPSPPPELVVVRRGAAAGARQHGRRAQRVLVHARQEVRRGPAQDARGARVARGERDRQRAAVRRAARDATTTSTRANLSLEEMFQQTVAGFAQALEESDLYTRGHSERVAVYSRDPRRAASRCPTPRSGASCRPA